MSAKTIQALLPLVQKMANDGASPSAVLNAIHESRKGQRGRKPYTKTGGGANMKAFLADFGNFFPASAPVPASNSLDGASFEYTNKKGVTKTWTITDATPRQVVKQNRRGQRYNQTVILANNGERDQEWSLSYVESLIAS